MSYVGDEIRRAIDMRDRQELREIIRDDRYEAESYLRYEARAELSYGDRDFAARVARDEGLDVGW